MAGYRSSLRNIERVARQGIYISGDHAQRRDSEHVSQYVVMHYASVLRKVVTDGVVRVSESSRRVMDVVETSRHGRRNLTNVSQTFCNTRSDLKDVP